MLIVVVVMAMMRHSSMVLLLLLLMVMMPMDSVVHMMVLVMWLVLARILPAHKGGVVRSTRRRWHRSAGRRGGGGGRGRMVDDVDRLWWRDGYTSGGKGVWHGMLVVVWMVMTQWRRCVNQTTTTIQHLQSMVHGVVVRLGCSRRLLLTSMVMMGIVEMVMVMLQLARH